MPPRYEGEWRHFGKRKIIQSPDPIKRGKVGTKTKKGLEGSLFLESTTYCKEMSCSEGFVSCFSSRLRDALADKGQDRHGQAVNYILEKKRIKTHCSLGFLILI